MIGFTSIPCSFAHTPIAARKTTQPTVPPSAATPSFSVRPMAMPMAKSSGRLPKDRVAGFRHDVREALRQPREVRAADAEQDAGDGQHRNRQHHAFADFLQEGKGVWELSMA